MAVSVARRSTAVEAVVAERPSAVAVADISDLLGQTVVVVVVVAVAAVELVAAQRSAAAAAQVFAQPQHYNFDLQPQLVPQ